MIILITGGSGSGKSTLARKIKGTVVSTDDFYFGKSEMQPDENGCYDFDDPASVDLKECSKVVKSLNEGKPIKSPIYDMSVSERTGTKNIKPHESGIVVVEGIFSFHSPLRELGDLLIFIDTPMDLRVARRLGRDIKRGRSEEESLRRAIQVEESYRKNIEPVRKYANVLLGRDDIDSFV